MNPQQKSVTDPLMSLYINSYVIHFGK